MLFIDTSNYVQYEPPQADEQIRPPGQVCAIICSLLSHPDSREPVVCSLYLNYSIVSHVKN